MSYYKLQNYKWARVIDWVGRRSIQTWKFVKTNFTDFNDIRFFVKNVAILRLLFQNEQTTKK